MLEMKAVRLVPERALASPLSFILALEGGEAEWINVRKAS
jgi:hypothetical protein